MTYIQSRINRTPYPQFGGGYAVMGTQNSAVREAHNSVPSPLSPERKLRPPKWSMKH